MYMNLFIIATALFLASSAQAEEQVYKAEGRFTMGDDDTKQDAQNKPF